MASRFVLQRKSIWPYVDCGEFENSMSNFVSPINGSIKRIIMVFGGTAHSDFKIFFHSTTQLIADVAPILWAGQTISGPGKPQYCVMNEEINYPVIKGDRLRVVYQGIGGINQGFEVIVVWEAEREDDVLIGDKAS